MYNTLCLSKCTIHVYVSQNVQYMYMSLKMYNTCICPLKCTIHVHVSQNEQHFVHVSQNVLKIYIFTKFSIKSMIVTKSGLCLCDQRHSPLYY